MKKILLLLVSVLSLFSCETDDIYSNEDLNVEFGTINVNQITATTAQLSCNISNNMQALDQAGFCIDKAKDPILSTAEKKYELTGINQPSSESKSIGCSVAGLDPSTQYYVRSYVKIGSNVNYGPLASFKTLAKAGTDELVKLPVVFHIIYSDRSNPNQYVLTPTITTIVDNCNAMFRNTYPGAIGIDTKIELELAKYDNNGLPMQEPGIHRVQSSKVEYDLDYFASNRKESIDEMWNPSTYINIWIFTFPKNNIVGQSHIAYCTETNPLGGLRNGDAYFYNTPKYAHGVYMSNKFIGDIPFFAQSLTHEIGHYLGLFHVFETKNSASCDITNDYCDDTKTYIRSEYENQIDGMLQQNRYFRRDCITLETYEATNYMDYDYCRFTTFTPNQIARMRHVLKYSPLVPGATPSKSTKTITYPIPEPRLM